MNELELVSMPVVLKVEMCSFMTFDRANLKGCKPLAMVCFLPSASLRK